ncbi:APC family permease [Nocardioides flavescens]|uniref:Amino acid permease n=1 Tax=Nocardioides flavescens TaxID=2691959 RepID=A0A6L7F0A2_9ACTN|nr:APC family permease [Nocardioides flavescens]MXG89442.1 amino acid permease [Nocardioides flavescens]
MSATEQAQSGTQQSSQLQQSITGRLLFFYVLGDVLGSGIYVLIGTVAGAVGGAFWLSFAVGVSVALITGLAYAELATKYPQAAGASLYVNRAFASPFLTFLVTVTMLAAGFAASGSLATGFASYFSELWELPPPLLVSLVFVLLLAVVNYVGIVQSVVANLVMTVIEAAGLAVVIGIGIYRVAQGGADFGRIVDFSGDSNAIWAVVAGVGLAFFAMTGFENAANLAEEAVDPQRDFPRALIGGMATAGVIYVLVSISAVLVIGPSDLAASGAPLLDVVEAGGIPLSVTVVSTVFAVIACVAITNTTLASVVMQSRVLYGMSREDVVPKVFGRVHSGRKSPYAALSFSAIVVCGLLIVGGLLNRAGLGIDVVARLAAVTVLLLLVVYFLVILAALRLHGRDHTDRTFRAPAPLLVLGLVANLALAVYVVQDDPYSVVWCLGLIGVGLLLYLAERLFGRSSSDSSTADGADGATDADGVAGS